MQYAYSILFGIVLAEGIGLPLPATLALLISGGACAQGKIDARAAVAIAMTALLIADNLLFALGRRSGWGLLGVLCRISLNPEACVMKAADRFYRRGRILLIAAHFFPGINVMAPPLAGSMGMKIRQFLLLDFAGVTLYICTFFGAGYIFSDVLRALLRGYSRVGRVAGWLIGAALVLWIGNRLRIWLGSRGASPVAMLEPGEIAGRDNVAIFDVRSHGYYDKGTMRIRNSTRIEPNMLAGQLDLLPKDRKIVLYCTCYREATSVMVARALAGKGISSAVIRGGLEGWKKASLPLEPVPAADVVTLPKFS
jgi:membrane protein DedA with SNARE-associated domain/rhodanese-related sulfurtransferase